MRSRGGAAVPGPAEVLVAVGDGVRLLDVAGPMDVFEGVTRLTGGGYRVRLAAPGGADVRTSCGVRLGVDVDLADIRHEFDTLLLIGGSCSGAATGGPHRDSDPARHTRRLAGLARRVASIGTGDLALDGIPLQGGRSAGAEPGGSRQVVKVVPHTIRGGGVRSAEGIASAVDLALTFVEDDHGGDVAHRVAKWLVRRPDGRPDNVARLPRMARDPALRSLLGDIVMRPEGDFTVPAMADRLSMSVRHFSRRFSREVGMSPGRFVERARVEAARAAIEEGNDPLEVIARRHGFLTGETMRRSFLRLLGAPPSAYRARDDAVTWR
ncbi:GlxA family transcriptional regulator [Nonomuraea diastatica]|uniref:Helix-turn-helix domain-containing protein n=1 Tax=Nonomuraea diastatica TaxID=1848329 RepID=A0A4R4VTH4_9ACTN|nr:helix-turn-helix domain-containing protein [Nonomuraea diastatica]TDD03560.1 helix-turn-helix domain-containing protein [Nonomuraea diastatica]